MLQLRNGKTMLMPYLLCAMLLCKITTTRSFKCERGWEFPENGEYNTTSDIRNDMINVHLIPHSHDDPGWIKTVDQYYYGSEMTLNTFGVQYILNNAVTELLRNKDRKFMFVEQSFFTRWWNEQTNTMKEVVRALVKEGRLDLSVNGGWVMHDEATTHYTAMIDQTTLGHRFLKKEFNVIPKIGWQIDPFGHSATQASLLSAAVGFDALYIHRISINEYNTRVQASTTEFVWRGSSSLGKRGEIFTGVLLDGYGSPEGFDFEDPSGDPIKDDPSLEDFNLCEKLELAITTALDRSSVLRSKHIYFTMGSDFRYQNAYMQYRNIDKLIHYANKDGRINMFYSTLSKYTAARQDETQTFDVKTGDFFPYRSDYFAYWNGYFTSRPTLKRYGRLMNGFLQAARRLEVYSPKVIKRSELMPFAQSIALLQHHDAITGTEKQAVAYDYIVRIAKGLATAERQVASILSQASHNNSASYMDFCWLRNISICETTQTNKVFKVTVFNPLTLNVPRIAYVRIPVNSSDETLLVLDKSNNEIVSEVVTAFKVPYVTSAATSELVFPVRIKGLTIDSFIVKHATPESSGTSRYRSQPSGIRNKHLEAMFTPEGDIQSLRRLRGGVNGTDIIIELAHDFGYYNAYQGDENQKSGAYIFSTITPSAIRITNQSTTPLIFTIGKNVQEARKILNSWASVTYRLYDELPYLEVEWTIGPIPVDDNQGKEVISRFSSNINSSETWYTDSNGREFIKRKRQLSPSQPISGNYFPMTSGVYINDSCSQLTILTDRSQGVASLNDGQIEVMVHRRLQTDDSRGVDEVLNETESGADGIPHGLVAKGSFYLLLETPSGSAQRMRETMEEIFHPLVVGFSTFSESETHSHATSMSFSAIDTSQLPSQISLQTLELIDEKTILLRLAHMYALGEVAAFDKPIAVKITDYLPKGLKISKATEVTLSGNQAISTLTRMEWKSNCPAASDSTYTGAFDAENMIIRIAPMEIRTFIINLEGS